MKILWPTAIPSYTPEERGIWESVWEIQRRDNQSALRGVGSGFRPTACRHLSRQTGPTGMEFCFLWSQSGGTLFFSFGARRRGRELSRAPHGDTPPPVYQLCFLVTFISFDFHHIFLSVNRFSLEVSAPASSFTCT